MWDYDSFMGKARVYFERAQEHPKLDYEVLAIWLLLGLEFLLRAPLAKVSPILLAEPDSALDAAGFPSPEGSEPKSITAKTVIIRLQRVVPGFTPPRATDANYLVNLRNKELHTASVAVGLESSTWLPRFIRVIDVICGHLGLLPQDLIGPELLAQGRALVAEEDQKLQAEIAKRIAAAKALFSKLRPDEVGTRRLDIPSPHGGVPVLPGLGELSSVPSAAAGAAWKAILSETGDAPEFVACPACGERAPVRLQRVRATNERLEDESIFRDIVFIGVDMLCAVCSLELVSTAELRAAGLPQEYHREEAESLEERFGSAYEGEEYGNE